MVLKSRIALKTILILLLTNILVSGLFIGWSALNKSKEEYAELNKTIEEKKAVIPENLKQPLQLALSDPAAGKEQVRKTLTTELLAQDIQAVSIHLAGGRFLYGKARGKDQDGQDILSAQDFSALLSGSLQNVYRRTSHKLTAPGGSELGQVQLFFSDEARKTAIRLYVESLLIPGLIQSLSTAMLIFLGLYWIIIRPLRLLVKKTRELSEKEGDPTRQLTINSHDEIGQLARFLNTFIASLDQQFLQIKESSLSLNHSISELSENSHKIASTSNHQAAAVKEIVATMEDSDKLTKSISAGSHEVVELSQSSKKNVQEGFDIIKMNQQKMDEIKITNAKVLSQIRLLDESIKNISKILTIITSIADQTKIIAFNAELEAFQAGEAGKNFEIVANEIRRLADNTIHSTKEIQKSLAGIQNAAKHLNLSSQESAEKISEGWQLSSKVEKLFGSILHSSEVSTQAAEKINLSINQNSAALEQIFITLKQLASGITEIAEKTQDMNVSSTTIRQLIHNLEEIVQQYGLNSTAG